MSASTPEKTPAPQPGPLGAGAQENIAVAGKYLEPGDGHARKTRDWQLYFLFRILTQTEAAAAAKASKSTSAGTAQDDPLTIAETLERAHPALLSLTAHRVTSLGGPASPGQTMRAATEFRSWLNFIAGGRDLAPKTDGQLLDQLASEASSATGIADLYPTVAGEAAIAAIRNAGSRTISQGLATVAHYEVLRHHWLADLGDAGGALRPQLSDDIRIDGQPMALAFDPASINIAFTFNGLKQLGLNELVLRSFPDAFRDGMAARAARLHDTGPSAPENWYGELGSARVHGYFTGGYSADGASEDAWKSLRAEIDRFNTRDPAPGAQRTRASLQRLFAKLGMELMHIELGQAPYNIGGDGRPHHVLPRVEHFGFRDGVSQPFVDLKLRPDGSMIAPAPGGATPGRNRTWTPLATGEVYLGYPDEDGHLIAQPANRTLRIAGTYLVFRKLSQDVVAFRHYLSAQRPGSPDAQNRLAAQIVGRWKSGTSLVTSPDYDTRVSEPQLNDFRYAEQDPPGDRCPLGAHVRRANPRDIGGRNNVRRHRLMRRSMSYGGPLLADGSQGDGEERGLLFIAANARIDMQFELVQADWLNRGEFLGQAGLGKCPLTGANDGAVGDAFLEAGKGAPVTGIPRFVVTRGGDYFFAPSLDALRGLADEHQTFPPDIAGLAARGHSFGDARTEGLFSEERLAPLVLDALAGRNAPVGFRQPAAAYGQASFGNVAPVEPPHVSQNVVFVRSHADVSFVLSSKPDPKTQAVAFTAAHSRIAGNRMLGRGNLLVGTDWENSASPGERDVLLDILREAWDLNASDWRVRLTAIVKQTLNAALARTAPAGRLDLVRDFAADATFGVVTRIFGISSPDYLTELAMATPFGRRHVGQVHPDWLTSNARASDENPGLVTLKVWSFLVGLNLVGDLQVQKPVVALGQQAASEALLHIDTLLALARERRPRSSTDTLLAAFVAKEQVLTSRHGLSASAYYDHVRSLLFELALTASAIIPAVFGKLMDASFRFGLDLTQLVPALDGIARAAGNQPDEGIHALIYELNRLDPALPVVLRCCEAPAGAVLPSGVTIRPGQWVAALVAAANLDGSAFPGPDQFSLGALLPGGKPRDRSKYLMFGVQDAGAGPRGTRVCWGRDRVALFTLTQCMRAASRLPGLRRVPGPEGQLKKLLGIASGLKGRFAPFTPD